MRYKTTDRFVRKLSKIEGSNPELYARILNKIELFISNEKHPSLRLHKLNGSLSGYWSISVDKGIRIIYFVENGIAIFVSVGTHDEVYRMN